MNNGPTSRDARGWLIFPGGGRNPNSPVSRQERRLIKARRKQGCFPFSKRRTGHSRRPVPKQRTPQTR